MYCLSRCFTRTALFTAMFTVIIVVCSLKSVCSKFHRNWLLCSDLHVPIVMYGLRLFIVVLQELHCLPYCLHSSFGADEIKHEAAKVLLFNPLCDNTYQL